MKDKFKEFYNYSEDEIKSIWKQCTFCFDANVLLDLYRYRKSTSDDFIKILNKISEEKRLWLPHQAGLEFHKNRIALIADLKNSYTSIKGIVENSFSGAQKKIDDQYHNEHPFLDLSEIKSKIEKCQKDISETIKKSEEGHPDWLKMDEILEFITKIFDKNIGREYSTDRLSEILKEGERRYENKIPPGFEDSKTKDGDQKYGDLILWFQIIDMARESKKSIIFITRDNKSDWWWKQSGNTLGPRHELKREIKEKADVDFHMYSSEKFLEFASTYYSETVDTRSIDEVRRMSMFLEKKNYMMHKMMRAGKFKSPFIHDFIMQLEMLNEELFLLVNEMDLGEEILFEFSRNQERIMHLIDRFGDEKRPHPMMLDELLMLQERTQKRLLFLMESKEMSGEQKIHIMRLLERMNESCIMFAEYADDEISGKYRHGIKINNERLRERFKQFL